MEGEGSRISKRMRYDTYSSGGGKDKACVIFYCHDDFTLRPRGNLSRIECNICIVDLKSGIPVGTLDDDVHSKSDNPVGALADEGVSPIDEDDDDGDSSSGGDDEERDVDDDKRFTRVPPTIQIDCGTDENFAIDAFCVVDGTLYMFAGCIATGDKIEKSVFAFDVSQITQTRETSTKLEKGGSLLEKKIGDMLSPKICPAALPTPHGGKIVVFPTEWVHLNAEDDESTMSCGGFELFDPAKSLSPEPLPPITGVFCREIQHYGFIENSDRLLVQVSCRGMYYLDLASSDKRWIDLDAFYSTVERIPIHAVRPSFFETVEKGRFCFVNRRGLYDLQDIVDGFYVEIFTAPGEDEDYPSRRSQFGRLRYVNVDRRVARCLSDQDEEGKYHFCQMLMQRPENQTESCRVAIAVCCVDLKLYMEKMMIEGEDPKREYTKVVKNHRIMLCFEGKRHLYHRTHLFFTF